MYVNNTIEILTTFVHLLIQQSLGSFPHVQVCVHTVGSVVGTEWDESQDRKNRGPAARPFVQERQKRSLNCPRAMAKKPAQTDALL